MQIFRLKWMNDLKVEKKFKYNFWRRSMEIVGKFFAFFCLTLANIFSVICFQSFLFVRFFQVYSPNAIRIHFALLQVSLLDNSSAILDRRDRQGSFAVGWWCGWRRAVARCQTSGTAANRRLWRRRYRQLLIQQTATVIRNVCRHLHHLILLISCGSVRCWSR